MNRFDELHRLNDEMQNNKTDLVNHLLDLGDETRRMASQFENVGEIIAGIDKDFAEATGIINPKDLTFLFTATALLCTKWLIMGQVAPLDFDFKHDPNARERIDSKEGDKLEKEKRKKHKKFGEMKNEKENYSEEGYRTAGQILFRPVPYDAFEKGTSGKVHNLIPDGLSGKSKRWLTFGHDPILGWLFGTVNIMTRSVTFKQTWDTYKVSEKGIIIYENEQSTFPHELYHAFCSYQEDNMRLPAAVFKQGAHLLSDKYTKTGLPIPGLSAEKARELIEKGWNSEEAKTAIKKVLAKVGKNLAIIGAQYIISFLINEIIKAIHLMMYDEEKDGDFRLYQVRTRKILLTANCISSSSNILYCAIFGIATKNPLEAAKRLDIGGFIETIRRLVVDTKFINEIKREYIQENLADIILNNSELEWWHVDEEGVISMNKKYIQGADDVSKVAAKALSKVGDEIKFVANEQQRQDQKQSRFNHEIIDVTKKHDGDIKKLKFGSAYIDFALIEMLSPEVRSIISWVVREVAKDDDVCKEIALLIVQKLSAVRYASPSMELIRNMDKDAQRLCTFLMHALLKKAETEGEAKKRADEFLHYIELSSQTKDEIWDYVSEMEDGELFTLIQNSKQAKTNVLVVGRNTVYLSSVINYIFGKKLAPKGFNQNESAVETITTENSPVAISGVFEIADDLHNNDLLADKIINHIKSQYNSDTVSSIIYCISMERGRFLDYEENFLTKILRSADISVVFALTPSMNKMQSKEIKDNISSRLDGFDIRFADLLTESVLTGDTEINPFGNKELLDAIYYGGVL